MRKFFGILLLMALLLCMVPTAFAAGSASLSGSGSARAGETITVSFSAGGGILGGSGTLSYDSSLVTLKGCKSSLGGSWSVDFNGNNFAFWDDSLSSPISGSKTIFTATFTVNADVTPGTTITISANNILLSDGNSDSAVGSRSTSLTVLAPPSDNCNLASLSVSNATISPAFSTGTTSYTANVPFAVSSLSIDAKAEHSGAKVVISNNSLTAGGTTTVKITVTAETGATKVYSIKVKREQDPNYVPSNNAKLSSLSAKDHSISPNFSAGVTEYTLQVPYETETVTLNAKTADNKATLSIGKVGVLEPGKSTPVKVTVTAEDGTKMVYTVTITRELPPVAESEATEPVIEDTIPTEATLESTLPAEKETEPAEDQEPILTVGATQEPEKDIVLPIITGVSGLIIGACVTFIIMTLVYRKKK